MNEFILSMQALAMEVLNLALVLYGFYIVVYPLLSSKRFPHPVTVPSKIALFCIRTVGLVIVSLFALTIPNTRTKSTTKNRDDRAYEKALSLTSLDSRVLKTPRKVTHALDSWNTVLANIQISPGEYYTLISDAVTSRRLANVKITTFYTKQGGLFSPKRKYLRLRRGRHVLDISCIPYGRDTLVSWWLGLSFPGILGFITRRRFIGKPFVWLIGKFIKPATYYRIDTARAFKKVIETVISEVHKELTSADAFLSLDEAQKPILLELSEHYGGLHDG
ncbi:MAG: hypothetical protein AAF564_02780 [Bacteroidota bacterium]